MKDTIRIDDRTPEQRKMPKSVIFKTKVKYMVGPLLERRAYVALKTRVKRADCNLRPVDHAYYNSDLFEGMLNCAYRKITGDRDWLYLDSLPSEVTVDTSKFLAVVTVELPESFH